MKDSRIVMRGVRKHGLYSLEEEIVDGSVASISVRDMSRTELWHRRLGIARHKSIARTPQQNGLVERFNRTILERVRLCSRVQLSQRPFGQKL